MLPPPGYNEHRTAPYSRAGHGGRELIAGGALPSANAMLDLQRGRFVPSVEVGDGRNLDPGKVVIVGA